MNEKQRIHPHDLVGIAPDLTDGLPSEDWLRAQRDEGSFTDDSHTMMQATSEVLAFFEPKIRADERRAVIEELAREAEEHEKQHPGDLPWREKMKDDPLIVAFPGGDYDDWMESIGGKVAAWLRAHVEEKG